MRFLSGTFSMGAKTISLIDFALTLEDVERVAEVRVGAGPPGDLAPCQVAPFREVPVPLHLGVDEGEVEPHGPVKRHDLLEDPLAAVHVDFPGHGLRDPEGFGN